MSFLQSVIDRGISRDTIPIIAFLNKSMYRYYVCNLDQHINMYEYQ